MSVRHERQPDGSWLVVEVRPQWVEVETRSMRYALRGEGDSRRWFAGPVGRVRETTAKCIPLNVQADLLDFLAHHGHGAEAIIIND